jgi:hypothetical protein
MDKFTQKYTIVQFFDDIEEGYEYSSDNWPLHSTVLDTFAMQWTIDEMIAKLTESLKHHEMAHSEAGDDRFFGENGQVQAVLLSRTDSLTKLHLDVLAILENGKIVLNNPQFARDGYVPHVTVQKQVRLNRGDIVRFTALSIVDMFPNNDPYVRKVLKTIKINQ